jgi:hypothetical protein
MDKGLATGKVVGGALRPNDRTSKGPDWGAMPNSWAMFFAKEYLRFDEFGTLKLGVGVFVS